MRVIFRLRSLATQGGSVTHGMSQPKDWQRVINSVKNFSFRKIDRQLGLRSHNVRKGSCFAFVAHCKYIDEF